MKPGAKPLGHEMILASAGSGKTYALTHRFVQLLARGAPPERIVALTFTRKAAGEFFDEILNKLARAATETATAEKIAREIGEPQLGRAEFGALLRAMVDAMPRLSLGTFDGFFGKIVRAFPLELGLAGDFEILREHAARIERRRVLRRMFARQRGGPDGAQREFIEAFKRATFGVEEKRLLSRLDAFLDAHQEIFLGAPRAEPWGNARAIWPEGSVWIAQHDVAAAAGALRDAMAARSELNDKQRARWADFFETLPAWLPGAPLPRPVEYIVKNAFDVWAALVDGSAEITIERRKVALTPAECERLVALVRAIVGAELIRRMEVTRGIQAVLHGYETLYHDIVRRGGRLTFADVQRLLAPEAGAPALTCGGETAGEGELDEAREAAAERRLAIDWRLDARFDHWLLDEFQDTSYGQWSVLRPLIDEAVQDAEQRRSFFYVGDVKQAIYAWREGDARLFREIFDLYNEAGGPPRIAERRLDLSWRSGPPILEMVNTVFGAGEVLGQLFPADAARRWSREWRAHASARPELGGQAAWLHADDEAGRFATTLRLLEEIQPLERGLSVAVLVQKNATAAQLADYLRREGGWPAMAESDLQVCTDNPLTAALLALCQAAAHPGDLFAWEHVQMTPLAAVLKAEGLGYHDLLTGSVLAQIHGEGFEATIEGWLRKLEPHLAPDDAFSRERGRQMAEAARLYDETGSRDVAEFIQFLERHTVRDADTAAVVRVMTVYKAKGLGFDLVILPDLEGDRLASRRDGLAVQKMPDRTVSWILDLPPRLFHENDEALSAHVQAAEADACYEKLALLYVAMTRAKRAMYVVTEPAPTSTSHNFPKLLGATLGAAAGEVPIGGLREPGPFAVGDAQWFTELRVAAVKPVAPGLARLRPEASVRVPRLPARTPSGLKAGIVQGSGLFDPKSAGAAEFGTAVHAALAAVEWSTGAEAVPTGGRGAQARRAPGVEDDAWEEARACVLAPTLAAVFRRPAAAHVEVWRERTFEVVLDGAWITGIFDRVVIVRDVAGRVTSVAVHDFKTDRVKAKDPLDWRKAAARYRGQLETYRRVAALLAGVPTSVVSCAVVLTAVRQSVEIVPELFVPTN